jgi:hypothetical protein
MSDMTIQQGTVGQEIEVYANPLIMTSTTDWACSLTITAPDGTVVLTRAVTDTNVGATRFVDTLAVGETAALPVETYTMVITLVNILLVPAFISTETHNIMIEPAGAGYSNHEIVKGGNSFGTYAEILEELSMMPTLAQANGVDRLTMKAAAIQAWYNVGRLTVEFGNEIYTTLDFDEDVLSLLTATEVRKLRRAQLIETDFILGGNPVEQRRRLGLMSDSSGESAHFFRPSKPIELAICRDAAMELSPHVRYSAGVGRG